MSTHCKIPPIGIFFVLQKIFSYYREHGIANPGQNYVWSLPVNAVVTTVMIMKICPYFAKRLMSRKVASLVCGCAVIVYLLNHLVRLSRQT
jgi:hypothetical protein